MIFRAFQDSDQNAIRDSFCRGVRDSRFAQDASHSFLRDMVDEALARWGATIVCDEETPDEIMGWAIIKSPREVFWLSVKPRYRKNGIGRALADHMRIPRGLIHIPIVTLDACSMARHLGCEIVQSPYMAWLR